MNKHDALTYLVKGDLTKRNEEAVSSPFLFGFRKIQGKCVWRNIALPKRSFAQIWRAVLLLVTQQVVFSETELEVTNGELELLMCHVHIIQK